MLSSSRVWFALCWKLLKCLGDLSLLLNLLRPSLSATVFICMTVYLLDVTVQGIFDFWSLSVLLPHQLFHSIIVQELWACSITMKILYNSTYLTRAGCPAHYRWVKQDVSGILVSSQWEPMAWVRALLHQLWLGTSGHLRRLVPYEDSITKFMGCRYSLLSIVVGGLVVSICLRDVPCL